MCVAVTDQSCVSLPLCVTDCVYDCVSLTAYMIVITDCVYVSLIVYISLSMLTGCASVYHSL